MKLPDRHTLIVWATLAAVLALLPFVAHADAASKERVCRSIHPISQSPGPEVFTHGVGCPQARRVLGKVFKRSQVRGLPLKIEGFRCIASEFPTIECTRNRKRIDYYGGA